MQLGELFVAETVVIFMIWGLYNTFSVGLGGNREQARHFLSRLIVVGGAGIFLGEVVALFGASANIRHWAQGFGFLIGFVISYKYYKDIRKNEDKEKSDNSGT